MKDNFIKIDTFSNEIDAQILKGKLEASNINAVIESDDCGGSHPALAFGSGITVKVAEQDYEKAISDFQQSHPTDYIAKYHLALAYLQIGDKTKAIEKLKEVKNYTFWVFVINEILRSRAERQLALLKSSN